MVVDSEVRSNVTQLLEYSLVDTQDKIKRKSNQSSLELDLDKILMITQLPITIQNSYSDIITWSSYDFEIAHLQVFTLVYYSQIFLKESIIDLDYFDHVDYKNLKQKVFDQDLIKFHKEVETLYSKVTDSNKLSDKILDLVRNIKNHSFGNDSTFTGIMSLICDNQPFLALKWIIFMIVIKLLIIIKRIESQYY